ncbi:MAG TPA: hypothetical protein VL490_12215 [Mucilaginibacter sp.]|jgi:hypothetical protein|nr:hypothetical protein [Mucilaginibacter sp.]
MFETVTVDEAIARGRRMLTYPSLVIFFGGWILFIYLAVKTIVSFWFLVLGFVPAGLLAWLYWSIMVTHWRLWAFENVRNVHELQKRAVKKQLLAKDGKFIQKTEIWSADQKAKWESLQDKFKQDDVFNDDYNVPPETVIHYSKTKAFFALSIGLVFVAGGCWLFFTQEDSHFSAIAGFLIGGFLFVMGLKHYLNHQPQVILSNDGVQLVNTPFYSWGQVTDEDTELVRRGKSSTMYLKYTCPEGDKRIEINELEVSSSAIENLLRVYRGRYTQAHEQNRKP